MTHLNWINKFEKNYQNKEKLIAAPLKKEIYSRLNFLNEVGLNYLSLSRKSSTLSGGESQRIRLAQSNWFRINWGNICIR
jgi:excinuclease ABC subunit A